MIIKLDEMIYSSELKRLNHLTCNRYENDTYNFLKCEYIKVSQKKNQSLLPTVLQALLVLLLTHFILQINPASVINIHLCYL